MPKRTKSTDTTPRGIPYKELTIGIPKETYALEKRVAATPDTVALLLKHSFRSVVLESQAGAASHFSNAAYEAAGARIVDSVWKEADIVLKVRTKNSRD
jgi:H+-translocating NAD(P) transhydrogenase